MRNQKRDELETLSCLPYFFFVGGWGHCTDRARGVAGVGGMQKEGGMGGGRTPSFFGALR